MSLRDKSGTPNELFEKINRRFYFSLDAAADVNNFKVDNYYTEEDNGLLLPWKTWTWCNPPYSMIPKFVNKAIEENKSNRYSVLLLPNDCSTKWYKNCVYNCSRIVQLIGSRVQFDPPPGIKYSTNPFSSILAIFCKLDLPHRRPSVTFWDWKNEDRLYIE